MARRRYVSTTISQDTRVNKLAVLHGDFAALLYTWMIPHAADDATLPGDPEELLYQVLPGRRDKTEDDVRQALDGMAALGLIIGTDDGRITFPPTAFYRYQTYIKQRNQHSDDAPPPPQNSADDEPAQTDSAKQRKTAQNASSFKSSLTPSFKSSPSPSVNPSGDGGSPPPRPLSPAPRPAIAAHPLPSIESIIDQLTPWATKKGITDILADEVERFHLHCLTKIDPETGRAPGKREPMYLNYAAACQKWITNPNYDHAPRSRAPAQPFGRSNAQAREDELLANVYAFNPPERQLR